MSGKRNCQPETKTTIRIGIVNWRLGNEQTVPDEGPAVIGEKQTSDERDGITFKRSFDGERCIWGKLTGNLQESERSRGNDASGGKLSGKIAELRASK